MIPEMNGWTRDLPQIPGEYEWSNEPTEPYRSHEVVRVLQLLDNPDRLLAEHPGYDHSLVYLDSLHGGWWRRK